MGILRSELTRLMRPRMLLAWFGLTALFAVMINAVMFSTASESTGGPASGPGVAFPDATGALRVFFPSADGLRSLAPGRLPPHETAWAMTVHKSQGSEFDSVALVLPERDSPLLSRELVYTAVTRARRRVAVYGAPKALAAAVTRRSERISGLRDLLAGA